MRDPELYSETHRPQFHFTPQRNWTNDPNGLVYYQGEYHLFFQHNPSGINWGNMTWGHAVSPDLVHWQQLDDALEPDELGTIYSGSAVVDWRNSSGFQQGGEPPLVAFYTSAGEHAPEPRPFTQSIAYSNDRGRTWTRYQGNPVIGHIRASNRDPKVIWHAPSQRWIMALYLDANDYTLYSSANLREWERLCDLALPGVAECPDIFELPVDGDASDTRWVYWGASGGYVLGQFDGRTFTPETDVLHAEYGANGYAAQTWSDIPAEDGRRLQISWMAGGKYPAMPFNQQMSFPVELTLRQLPEGIRLCRRPAGEIKMLYRREHVWEQRLLPAGDDLIPEVEGELFDISVEIEPQDATAIGVRIRGIDLTYDVSEGQVCFLGKSAALPQVKGSLILRLLVDRTSLELFGNQGAVSMSTCFLPEAADHHLVFCAMGGTARLTSLAIRELSSAWTASTDVSGECACGA
jgi:fructan beta-fructosidase